MIFLAKYLKINFHHLMDDYMDKKIQNKIYEIKDMLDNVQERIQMTISNIDLEIEDEEDMNLDDEIEWYSSRPFQRL